MSGVGLKKRAPFSDCLDIFLCHAWNTRKGTAKQLQDVLEMGGVSVWLYENNVALGTSLLR